MWSKTNLTVLGACIVSAMYQGSRERLGVQSVFDDVDGKNGGAHLFWMRLLYFIEGILCAIGILVSPFFVYIGVDVFIDYSLDWVQQIAYVMFLIFGIMFITIGPFACWFLLTLAIRGSKGLKKGMNKIGRSAKAIENFGTQDVTCAIPIKNSKTRDLMLGLLLAFGGVAVIVVRCAFM